MHLGRKGQNRSAWKLLLLRHWESYSFMEDLCMLQVLYGKCCAYDIIPLLPTPNFNTGERV